MDDGHSALSKISPGVLGILREIGEVGEKTGKSVYIVGGFVRDLLLGRENLELDVVLEGDAIALARLLAERWGGQTHTHDRFGTATAARSDGLKIDFVSARSETYARPGALPSVKRGNIVDDLWRRDFSINALAIRIDPEAFGEIVDVTDGLSDLRAGVIRALHDRSFIDDPTRIFRAIRYEQRYRFQIRERDIELIHDAVGQGTLNQVSGQRLRNEIDRILDEPTALQAVRRMNDLNLFCAIHPDWRPPENLEERWSAAQHAVDWSCSLNERVDVTAIRWMALFDALSVVEAVSDRLALENRLRDRLFAKAKLPFHLGNLHADSRPSEVYQLLEPYPLEAILFTLAQTTRPDWRRDKIEDYLIRSRKAQPLVIGDDLIQLGLKPGPAFADLLWRAFAAQLDGEATTKQEIYRLLGY
jgi:tRNA nucleotidyltransferase (CCA-adding enzyme)